MRFSICLGLSMCVVLPLAGCPGETKTEKTEEDEEAKKKKRLEREKHGNESAAIGALKTISTSQSIFREGDKEGDANEDYGTLVELSDQDLIDSVLGSGTKQGYVFKASYGSETSEYIWWATANPVKPGETGDRYFATNHEGVTYYSTKGPIEIDPVECVIPEDATPVGDDEIEEKPSKTKTGKRKTSRDWKTGSKTSRDWKTGSKTFEKSGRDKGPEYDVSHVKKGQVFEYTQAGGGKMMYVVTAKERNHLMYRMDMYIAANNTTMKGRKENRWPPEEKTWAKTGAMKTWDAKTPRTWKEEVEIAGMKFMCKVTERGKQRSWMSQQFPGLIKAEFNGKVTMELTNIYFEKKKSE